MALKDSFASRYNLDAIEQMHARWRQDPQSVDASWQWFFEGFDLGLARPAVPVAGGVHPGILRLIDAFRGLGHLLARLDPLSDPAAGNPLLELAAFGLSAAELDQAFDTSHFVGLRQATLRQLLEVLRETYCRTIGVEYMHIQDNAIRRWLEERMEPRRNRPNSPQRLKIRILIDLLHAELFEKFLHTRYLGQKRFSLEGAETLIPLLNEIVERSADSGVREIVLGMAHRGRLNVLANMLDKPYTEVFSEFEENYLPDSMAGDGDVKYHLGFSCDRVSVKGNRIHLSLSPNPSHLEAVNPVVEGRARAKQHQFQDEERVRLIPLLLHGDAAFAGQGLVAETLNLSQLQGYKTGGTIHIVINNQIGFTTSPADARSTHYCTDVAKMIEVPIFHVNADDPEACLFIADLAVEFRQTFHKDVVIDLYCYRKHGHNEGDEPGFTQPVMVAKIQQQATYSSIYTDLLITRGDLTVEEAEAIVHSFQAKLQEAQEEVRESPVPVGMRGYHGRWKKLSPVYNPEEITTGVSYDALLTIAEKCCAVPAGFQVHPKVASLVFEPRLRAMQERKSIDWAFAETLAFGSLLLEGVPVRLSGQDSRRGTFSQRHATLYDAKSGQPHVPLQHLDARQASFSAYDSSLSEAAVLGFELGYSLDSPEALVLWEAQFGDFTNGAQVIIDQFLTCSNSKWQRDSGLVLLLPHGYEGQGPEHSSARLERFLQQCAENNIQVVNPTTPAQYFHLLRRQMHRSFRKPLVVMTPKSLLRHKAAFSPLAEFTAGNFHDVIGDDSVDPTRVRRVILCSGKVYYDLLEARAKEEKPLALVRVEQFYPFPSEQLRAAAGRFPKAREIVWVQEESLNMGGWTFMEPRLRSLGLKPRYIGRDASASSASGSRAIHLREQKELIEAALTGPAQHLVRSVVPGPLRRFPSLASEGLEPLETGPAETKITG